MGWVKLDDQRAMNPKMRAVGFAARGLDEAALCQIAADGTDGYISTATVEMLAIGHRERGWRKLVDRLVQAGRWEPAHDGWMVHDYLMFNPSRAQEIAEREKKRAAGQRGGQASAQARATPSGLASGLAGGEANGQAVSRLRLPSPLKPVSSLLSTNEGRGQPAEVETVASNETETKTGRDLDLTHHLASICKGHNRAVVNLEAAHVILWATTMVDHKLIEEAIGWCKQQAKPPDLPRAVAVVIASKAADRGIPLAAFTP